MRNILTADKESDEKVVASWSTSLKFIYNSTSTYSDSFPSDKLTDQHVRAGSRIYLYANGRSSKTDECRTAVEWSCYRLYRARVVSGPSVSQEEPFRAAKYAACQTPHDDSGEARWGGEKWMQDGNRVDAERSSIGGRKINSMRIPARASSRRRFSSTSSA